MKLELYTEEIQVEKKEVVTSEYSEHVTIDTCNAELVNEIHLEDEPRRQKWAMIFKATKYPAVIVAVHEVEDYDGKYSYSYVYVWLGDRWIIWEE